MSSHVQVIATNISTVSYYTYLHVLLPWLLSGMKVTNLLWYRTFSHARRASGVYPSCESARHGQAASSLKGYIPTSTHRKVRARTVGRSRGPRENSHRHGQNMWTPHRKDPGPGIKPVTFSLGVDRHWKPLCHCITRSKDVFSSSKGTCVTHVGCFIMVKRRV